MEPESVCYLEVFRSAILQLPACVHICIMYVRRHVYVTLYWEKKAFGEFLLKIYLKYLLNSLKVMR